ncbi:uncharacterized protein J7T54_003166 [Emericellopsis cladophorae]|uniref:Uncharacterized protein n=1 Tax=Emericellopsis cladophorae TaxID=2686198 RepID=A0A9Q0BEA3_9HYPO|nr:uncharacterized protein J7T54_003166 [Emericellopsis cladophorae]KAI6781024.1 hypothetical protein J7T54_003166 [Emericellopsis cladophorae]
MKITGFVIALAASASAIPFKMADYTAPRAVEAPEVRPRHSYPYHAPGNLTARAFGRYNETDRPHHGKPTVVVDKRAFTPESQPDQQDKPYHNGIVGGRHWGPRNQTYHA